MQQRTEKVRSPNVDLCDGGTDSAGALSTQCRPLDEPLSRSTTEPYRAGITIIKELI